jgi:hypothetical protein
MSLSDLASLGSFVSGVAVLASLVFLYFQIRQVNRQVRQAERNQQASIRHSRVSRAVDIQLATADPGLSEVWLRGAFNPDEITRAELMQFHALCRARFLHAEDAFYQHEEGLLNESAFATMNAGVRSMAGLPGVRVAWEHIRHNHAGPFRDFMDAVVVRARLEPTPDFYSPDGWRADFAAETPGEAR